MVGAKYSTSKNIRKALADYVKTFTDKPTDNKSHGKTSITFIKDFLLSSFSFSNGSEGWNQSVCGVPSPFSFFNDRAIAFVGPPPKS